MSCVAWTYPATPTYVREGLVPRAAYLQRLLAGNDLFSEGYKSRLEAIETIH